ncbi:MAG: hypothetical protein EOO77_23730 [Oxalobacteraceae bacterium]|nr:MAG: hypothetical protein EOO77_23730 [Oxalobacteraceae bacterium]
MDDDLSGSMQLVDVPGGLVDTLSDDRDGVFDPPSDPARELRVLEQSLPSVQKVQVLVPLFADGPDLVEVPLHPRVRHGAW